MNLKVIDVRANPGDSAFLLDDGTTTVLYDTGFAFTGYAVADNVKNVLMERQLDYIFLTHSHYDHALGAAYIRKRYPNVKVVAGEKEKKIFGKPTARSVMRDLDRKFAMQCGVASYEDLIDELKVDIPVRDGDVIHAGTMDFTVVELPGHTKCSVGYYLAENQLLLATETLGVYCGSGEFLPSFLVGCQMSLDSIQKAAKLKLQQMLFPHYGLISGQELQDCLVMGQQCIHQVCRLILELLTSGKTTEEILEYLTELFYTDRVKPIYPYDAYRMNTEIMINLVRKELFSVHYQT